MLQNLDLFKASDFKCVSHNKKIIRVDLDPKAEKRILCSDCPLPSKIDSLRDIDDVISKHSTNALSQRTEGDILNVSNHVNGLLAHEIDKHIDHFADTIHKFRYVLKKQYLNLIEEEFKDKSKRRVDTLNQILRSFWTNGKIEDGKYVDKYIETFQELAENTVKIEQFRGFCDHNLHDLATKIKAIKEELKKKIEEVDHLFSNRETVLQKIFGSKSTIITPKKPTTGIDEEVKFDETSDHLSETRSEISTELDNDEDYRRLIEDLHIECSKLSVKFKKISSEELQHFSSRCESLASLTSINLDFSEQSDLNDENLPLITQVLGSKTKMKSLILNLTNCRKITNKGFEGLFKSLNNHRNLIILHLILARCPVLTDSSFEKLCESLSQFTNLTTFAFDLTKCFEISNKSVDKLAQALKGLPNLLGISIGFSGCKKISDAPIESFTEAIGKSINLGTINLDLAGSKVSDEGLQLIGKTTQKLSELKILNLNLIGCKQITETGMKLFAQQISVLPKLSTLNIVHSFLTIGITDIQKTLPIYGLMKSQ